MRQLTWLFTYSFLSLLCSSTLVNCTGMVPDSFGLPAQLQTFSASASVNTKIDLLWVVDNSSSMDASQDKLRNGFASFANQYLQPTWDIQIAVITTDTYLANPAFTGFLNSVVPETQGWVSPYISGRLTTFVNPPSTPNLVNLITGAFPQSGVLFNQMMPAWGPNYAKLLPGIHDGPIPGLCFEGMPYFLKGVTQCAQRDNQVAYNGPSHCLTPDANAGESSLTQCVNTLENNTVRSGLPILNTKPPTGIAGDATWTQQLINNFIVNATTGSAGHGSERGISSVLQLLSDNESGSNAFFRPGSLRGIIFISDEDDQSMTLTTPSPSGFTPFTHYMCDLPSLTAYNGAAAIASYCCSGGACEFGSDGTTCPVKTVGSYTYAVGICPNQSLLMPVTTAKAQLDSFFLNLDQNQTPSSANPNYFIVTIAGLTDTTLQALQAIHDADDLAAGAPKSKTADRSDRYIALGNLVGNGSLSLDIGSSSYTPVLDAIGQEIVEKTGTFTLARAPTSQEQMTVTLIHGNGTSYQLLQSQFAVNGNQLMITDVDLVLSFSSTDQISVQYVPSTIFQTA